MGTLSTESYALVGGNVCPLLQLQDMPICRLANSWVYCRCYTLAGFEHLMLQSHNHDRLWYIYQWHTTGCVYGLVNGAPAFQAGCHAFESRRPLMQDVIALWCICHYGFVV